MADVLDRHDDSTDEDGSSLTGADSPGEGNTARLEANLANLTRPGGLADEVRRAAVPVGVRPVRSRDGRETYLFYGPDGKTTWFGGSGMPGVRCRYLLSRFDAGGVNVVLPCLGTGHEVDGLLGTLSPAQAVFVIEPDLLAVRLALQLWDWSASLAAGRLILLQSVEPGLTAFLRDHCGYLFPERMMAHPFCSSLQTEEIRASLHTAAVKVAALREERLAAWASAPLAAREPPRRDGGRAAVWCPARDPAAVRRCDGLASAMKGRGIHTVVCDSRRADASDVSAHLAALHDHRPDWLILLDQCPGFARRFVDPSVPIVAWLGRDAAPGRRDDSAVTAGDIVMAVSPELCRQLTSTLRHEVRLLPDAADPPSESWTAPPPEDLFDVVIVTDVCDVSAEANGIALSSHVRIWEAAAEALDRCPMESLTGLAERALETAERKTRMTIRDKETRETLVQRMDAVLVHSIFRRRLVEGLLAGGSRIGVWGDGWSAHPSTHRAYQGRRRTDRSASLVVPIIRGRILVHFATDAAREPLVLSALAAERPVIIAGSRSCGSVGTGADPLGEVFGLLPSFPQLDAVVRAARHWIRNPVKRREACATAIQLVQQCHTMSHRLDAILRAVVEGFAERAAATCAHAVRADHASLL